jgi:hypothetical protein
LSRGIVKSLADSVIGFIELMEAEGRALRKNVARLCFMAVFFIIAGIMTISGFALLFNGVFKIVADMLGRVSAFFVTGSACILVSVALFAAGFREMSAKRGEREDGDFVESWRTEGDDPVGGKGEPEAISGDDKPAERDPGAPD